MIPSIVWTIMGIIVSIIWLATFVFGIIVLWRWWRYRLTDTIPEQLSTIDKRLTNIEGSINNLVAEIRKDRKERNKVKGNEDNKTGHSKGI